MYLYLWRDCGPCSSHPSQLLPCSMHSLELGRTLSLPTPRTPVPSGQTELPNPKYAGIMMVKVKYTTRPESEALSVLWLEEKKAKSLDTFSLGKFKGNADKFQKELKPYMDAVRIGRGNHRRHYYPLSSYTLSSYPIQPHYPAPSECAPSPVAHHHRYRTPGRRDGATYVLEEFLSFGCCLCFFHLHGLAC